MYSHRLRMITIWFFWFVAIAGQYVQGQTNPESALAVYSAKTAIKTAYIKTGDTWSSHDCQIGENIFIVGMEEVTTPAFGALVKSQFTVEVDGSVRQLFIPKSSLAAISSFTNESFQQMLKAKGALEESIKTIDKELIAQEYISKSPSSAAIPQIIAIYRKPLLEQAWASIQDAKKISVERMKNGEPGIADPYFAEALLWKTLGRHEEALANFSMGSHIAINNGDDLNDAIEYYREFNQYLSDYLAAPRPSSDPVTTTDSKTVARRYFARGIAAYNQKRYSDAIEAITEAILLNPNRASYWHYRALCFRAEGLLHRATHDVTIGIAIERKLGQRAMVYAALTSAQGKERLWLENHRNNNNIPILVKANDPNTTR